MRPTIVQSNRMAIDVLSRSKNGRSKFDFILVDAQMAGESGFILAEYIVKCTELPLPIMMLTSVAQGEGVERCSALGLSVYVVKPVSESDLFDAMMSIRGARSESVLEASADKQETAGRFHILVAEDNSVNQEVAQLMLQKRGYSVTIASNGREAVKLIAESAEFDVILMDIQMPEMDGFHATAAIREIESKGKRRTPIVAMTAHAMKGDRERCLEAGMDGYVSKPVQSKVLYEMIEAMTRPAVIAESLSHPPVPPVTTPVAREAVNLNEILDRLGGNVGLLQSIVSLFDEDCPGQMASIQAAIKANDADALAIAAHTLKGSLLALSAERASAAVLELEKMGRESRFQGAAELFAILESEVAAVGDELQKIVRERFAVGSRS